MKKKSFNLSSTHFLSVFSIHVQLYMNVSIFHNIHMDIYLSDYVYLMILMILMCLPPSLAVDPGCVESSEDSIDWLLKNMGQFFPLGRLVDMYALNPQFSAVSTALDLHLYSFLV